MAIYILIQFGIPSITVLIVYLYFDVYKSCIPITSISIGNSEVVC